MLNTILVVGLVVIAVAAVFFCHWLERENKDDDTREYKKEK